MSHACTDVAVDHVIFYAGQALDDLADFFVRVGFQLTPLGRHNSGSVNRLAMLKGQYIELMGFEPGTPTSVRPEIQSMAPGLNGIVATDPAGRVRRRLADHSLPGVHLERPVDAPGVQGVASFTITRVPDGAPDVRTFMCRHHTPDLVWRDEWQLHANGALSLAGVWLATRHPRQLHESLQILFDVDGGADPTAYDAAGTLVGVVGEHQRASIVVRTQSIEPVTSLLRRAEVQHRQHGRRVEVPLPQPYAADLVFEAAA